MEKKDKKDQPKKMRFEKLTSILKGKKDKEQGKTKKKKAVFNIREASKKTKKFFLSKPRMSTKKKSVNEALLRPFQTFFKVRFPRFSNNNSQNDLKSEVKNHLQNPMEFLWGIDPMLIILPWNEESHFQPLANGDEIPDGFCISRYVDRLFVKPNEFAYCRIILGHPKDKSKLINTDTQEWFEGSSFLFSEKRIQARKLCRVGWLLGSHPGILNTTNLQQALDQIHPFSRIKTEIQIERVNYKDKEKVRAAMISVAWKRAAKARTALKKIYSTKNKEGFPLGLQA